MSYVREDTKMGEETFERLYAAVNGALKYHLPVMDAFIEALEPGDNLGNGLIVVREKDHE